MFTRLTKAFDLASDRYPNSRRNRRRKNSGGKKRGKKNGELRLSVETLEPRVMLAADVLNQAVVSQDYAPVAVETAPADFNDDGYVNGGDLSQWEGDFGSGVNADADSDGDTDGADFLAWQRQFTGNQGTAAVGGTLVFSDDFSTDTIVNYTTQTTDGAGGSLLYDATNQRAQVTTGDNNGMMFSQGVTATDSGTFSIDFNPTVGFPSYGALVLRLHQDANNYYEIVSTDNSTPLGGVSKVVNGITVETVPFTSSYSKRSVNSVPKLRAILIEVNHSLYSRNEHNDQSKQIPRVPLAWPTETAVLKRLEHRGVLPPELDYTNQLLCLAA